jgi:hypothetical protein
MVDVEVTVVVV